MIYCKNIVEKYTIICYHRSTLKIRRTIKHMYSLKKSEEAICRLADTDPAAAEALGLLSVRYSDAELAHTLLIGAIYIERRNDQVWQLAMRGHISESTAYRYRKRYIATFYHFYRNLLDKRAQ